MGKQDFTEQRRPMKVMTPAGKDALLIRGFSGTEAISQLFHFTVDLFAENHKTISFDSIIGQKLTVTLVVPGSKARYFNGIVNRLSRGERGTDFTVYRAEVVPQFWTFTKKVQSRIFQHMTIPDILKRVLEGLDVTYEIQGTWYERDYCVQYHESDFNFASRLMEEEGIWYYFKHTDGNHKMVIANTPQSHHEMPHFNNIIYEEAIGELREDMRITGWEKVQELRSGKYTLWDHCFELPHKHLEADKETLPAVQVGRTSHSLRVGGNSRMEIYEYPGAYAQRFDGIDKGGGERPSDLQKIFEDNKRTVGIRMQQEEMPAIVIEGTSDCRHLTSGHKFTLERHFSDNGVYVVTGVQHFCDQREAFRTTQDQQQFHYANQFTCIPLAFPFRPPRLAQKPVVPGSQTAVVVGPAGEEIFTDKYGRVKVQFHWDREGQYNADSSCWIRVGTCWAGKNWGSIHIPRIGQEVIVDFLEGDPDQPIITGSVYNADMMPPYKLPDMKTVSTLKSRSTLKGTPENYNEIRMEDKKGKEQLFIHAEKDFDLSVENESREYVAANKHLIVDKDYKEIVKKNQHTQIKEKMYHKVDSDVSMKVGGSRDEKIGSKLAVEAGQEIHLKAGMKVILEAGVQLTIKGAGGFVDVGPAGVTIQGLMVKINSGGSAGSGSGASPTDPTDSDKADLGPSFGPS